MPALALHALPLLGMILGNITTGISLALDMLTNSLLRERAAVEACLALGGNPLPSPAACTGCFESGFMPIMNRMAAISLVSLPGRARFLRASNQLMR